MLLYVDYGESSSNEWKRLATLEGTPDTRYGETAICWDSPISLPTGTNLKIGGVYDSRNRSANIVVMQVEEQLLSVFGTKGKSNSYGPTIIFLCPCGTHLLLMLGQEDK
jgi:hypothetical protein